MLALIVAMPSCVVTLNVVFAMGEKDIVLQKFAGTLLCGDILVLFARNNPLEILVVVSIRTALLGEQINFA